MELTDSEVKYGVLASAIVLAAFVLADVAVTVFLSGSVAIVLMPVYRYATRRGLNAYWAAVVATAVAYVSAIAVITPFFAILYLRRRDILDALRLVPESFTIQTPFFTYVVDVMDLTASVASGATQLAVSIARTTPVLAVKFALFGFVVFGVLVGRDRIRRAVLNATPASGHDLAIALYDRIRVTLTAIYVLQAATAAGTFLVGLVVFYGFGYPFPLTLALLAGLLQFLPIVGPSIVIAVLVVSDLVAGDVVGAVAIAIVGGVFVAWLPDIVIRARFASVSARLPGSLYFVGFTGGLLTLGAVGIVAGPLAVAVLLEALSWFSHPPLASN